MRSARPGLALPFGCKRLVISPEAPLAGLHDPQSQEQVGGGVSENARSQATGPIGDNVVERAANEGRGASRVGND
jgi:hypothetical protein